MLFLLLSFLSLHTTVLNAAPTNAPVQLYWSRVACADDQGVVDCESNNGPGVKRGQPVGDIECDGDDPEDCVCADYWGRYPDPRDQDWIMALAAIFGMAMAFGIGANDAANSWATAVGSKATTVGHAVLLCGFFEWAGATSIGYGVSKTIQKGVSKLTASDCWACGKCDSSVTLTMGGSLGALIGASLFLLLASGTAVPVSTTHSIVGGVVGMTMAGIGGHCLNWELDGGLLGIIMSWIISPVLSGVIASLGYTLSLNYIIKAKNARKRAIRALPFLYGFITFGLMMMVFLKAKAVKKKMDLTMKFVASAIIGVAVLVVAWLLLIPFIEKNLPSETGTADKYLERFSEKSDAENPKTADGPKPADDTQTRAMTELKSQDFAAKVSDVVKQSAVAEADKDGNPLSGSEIVVSLDPETTPLRKWNRETAIRWITNLEKGRFAYLAEIWAKQQVDGECLMIINDSELSKDLQVNKIGDRKWLLRELEKLKLRNVELEKVRFKTDVAGQMKDAENADQLDAIFVFRYLIVFTACLESYAHGSNDTANATGPFSAVYQFYTNGGKDCSSDEGTVWIMCVAGIFVALGVGTFGYRVIRTIGTNLTMIDFHKGFYIEVGSTLATMIATVLEFPVSTTHCQVGGVIGVGLVTMFNGTGKVSWGLFGKIFLTWVLTLPIAGSIAAIVVKVIKGSIIIPDGCAA